MKITIENDNGEIHTIESVDTYCILSMSDGKGSVNDNFKAISQQEAMTFGSMVTMHPVLWNLVHSWLSFVETAHSSMLYNELVEQDKDSVLIKPCVNSSLELR